MSGNRRFTFGNDTSFRDDMDSMMTDDFDKMRERFHNRARNMRMDTGFDQTWFDQDRESAFHPRAFKIPKEDERSAYVRNIPIYTDDDSNLMRQTTSAVPKPVPPQNPPPHEPAGSRFSARNNDFPTASGFPSSFPSRPPVRNFPSNGSDSGIDRAASNSPSDISDSTGSASFPRFPASSRPRDTYSPPNVRKPKVAEEPPIKVEKVQNQEAAPMRKDGEPIPMGYLPTQRNPSEPIPLGYERPASAPMDATSQNNEKPKPARSNLEKSESGPSAKVHRVPIVVKQGETPRSASAPPKPTETTPPPPAAPKPKSPLENIEDIISEVQKLEARVSSFSGTRGDHEYRLLDELLTQAVLKLDVVSTEGLDEVRNARKKAIKRVHDAISKLENKTPVGGKKSEKAPEKSPTPPENKGKSPTPEAAAPIAGPHRIVIAMNPEKDKKFDDTTGSAANGNQTKETLIN